MVQKSVADKGFIAAIAKRATTSCAAMVNTHQTCSVLLSHVTSKSLPLAEFCIQTLNTSMVVQAPGAFFKSPELNDLILEMCLVMEGKKPRMVKHATAILNTCKDHLTRDEVYARCVKVLADDVEESKSDEQPAAQRVERIFAVLEPPSKKVDKSKDFRAFMRSKQVEAKPADGDVLVIK